MSIRPSILRETLNSQTLPLILFDREVIWENLTRFRRFTEEAKATWSYAVKALTLPEMLEMTSLQVDGFDVSNLLEFQKIKELIEPRHKVWLTNGKLAKELDSFLTEVHKDQLIVTVNDMSDYKQVKDKDIPFFIRILTSDLIDQPATSRFGIKLSGVESIKGELLSNACFKGFHLHQGVEENDFRIFKPILDSLKQHFKAFEGKGYTFNLGGSFQNFSDRELQETLSSLDGLFKVHIEPGRALLRNGGFAITPVEKFLLEDDCLRVFTPLSYVCHLKWSNPTFAGVINQDDAVEPVSSANLIIEGPTCYEYDQSSKIPLTDQVPVTVGSLILLKNINGYSHEWNTSFNGIPTCTVKFIGRRRSDSPE